MGTLADHAMSMLRDLDDGDEEKKNGSDQLAARAAQEAIYDRQLAFTKKFTKVYEAGLRPKVRKELHVSDVIGRIKCPRKMVLLHCYEQNLVFHSAKQSLIYDIGNLLHGLLQETLARSVENYEIEADHVETFWRVVFHPDLVGDFDWGDGQGPQPTIFEFKGYNENGCSKLFPHVDKTGVVPAKNLPKDAILQANIYAWFTGIRKSLVIVVNKNTQDWWVWPVEYDEELVKPWIPIFDQIKLNVDYHLAHPEKLPKRLAVCTSPDDKVPSKCGACTSCFASGQERLQLRRKDAWE